MCGEYQRRNALLYEESVMTEEELQEYHDLKELRAARAQEGNEPTLSLDEVKKELGLQ